MIIRNMTRERANDVEATSAEIVFEDCDRPAAVVRFEVPVAFSDLVTASPDAFLLAGLYPARHAGERRVRVDGAVCPYLVRGLETAMHWHRHWYGEACPVLPIEAQTRTTPLSSSPPEGALVMFSGGVDSLHTLRRNRLQIPPPHPASITHGLLIEGFDMRRGNTYARSEPEAMAIAADAGITLVPVRTSVRDLDLDDDFWADEFYGAALAAVAHNFAARFGVAYIASSAVIEGLIPRGSHPVVDPMYSSYDLRIRHDSLEVSRLEKVRLLADWPVALDHLRVCFLHPQESLNCERCEKCMRTMIELVAVGALARAGAFARDDITPEDLRGIRFTVDSLRFEWEETIPDLERRGRADLAAAVREVLARYYRWKAWKQERDWKGVIKRFDRKWTGGMIRRIAGLRPGA